MNFLFKVSRFIKIEHTLFALPLVFAGALLADKSLPSLRLSLLMVLAAAGARVVALPLNRIIDRHIDAQNPRTKDRHLSNGTMSLTEAWFITLMALVCYLAAAWLISDFCFQLSWIPLLGFGAYPFFKRFTKWTHFGLGLVWSFVPVAGFFGVKPSLEGIGPAVMLGAFSVFWLAGFDIIYATLDEKFDREAGLFSLPAHWGTPKALKMAGWFHLLAFLTLVLLYGVWFSGPLTVMMLAIIGILLFLEQKNSENVNLAFFKINALIGFLILFFVFFGTRGL